MANEDGFNFNKQLLQVQQALTTDEVEALVFLCYDLLDRDLSSVFDACTLFSHLMDKDILSAEKKYLLADLLNIIRPSLMRELDLSKCLSINSRQISPYRRMLYNLNENITKKELREIKFLLKSHLPRRKLEENMTTLEIFLEMERRDVLSETNLILLVNIIRHVCPMLETKICDFEAMKGLEKCEGVPLQRSLSAVCTRNKPDLQRQERPSSCEISDARHLQGLGLLTTNRKNPSNPIKAVVSSGDLHFGRKDSQNKGEALQKYSMRGKQRGFCMIINNYDFSNSLKVLNNRKGTEIDEESLVKVFSWLGFVTEVERDCTREKILHVLQQLRHRDHRQMDCLVCCVLSHGLERGVYGVDGKVVQLSELKEPFNGHQCPSLVDKPKLFFIQACQGQSEQQPVYIQADSQADRSICSDARVPRNSIPFSADFMIGMATVPQFASFRDKALGTWFIQSLCKNLVQMVPSGCDLMSILTKVNSDVSEMTDHLGLRKQMPQPEFSLRKSVVFPNPKDPPPNLF